MPDRTSTHPGKDQGQHPSPPIIVLSFDRPKYLARVLKSIKAQQPQIDERRVHLFQDGAVNAYSGAQRADWQNIAQCIALFCKTFPGGILHLSNRNIGICENYLRAEIFVFRTLNAPVAYFFEDDLVLDPRYVATLDVLRASFACEPRIGYFNAIGQHEAAISVQEAHWDKIVRMRHLWGFALTRSHWDRMQDFLSPYYDMVCGRDYRSRPHDEIRAWFRMQGCNSTPTSQDSAKDYATYTLGGLRLSTLVCLARYIGETGVHCTPEIFADLGYANTNVYTKPIPSTFHITPAEIEAVVSETTRIWNRQPGL